MSFKKYLVLGTGVGKTIAHALLDNSENNSVTIADIDFRHARDVVNNIYKLIGRQRLCFPMEFMVGDQNTSLIFKNYDVVISALPAKYNLELAEAAVKASVHFCDLGGVVKVTSQMIELNKEHPEMKVSIIPDCGLMPGLGVILAKKLLKEFDQAQDIEILVGGLPQKPRPPIYYQKVFSIEGLKHICYNKVPVLRNNTVEFEEPFSRYEEITVPELKQFSKLFDGDIEIFATSGASIAPWTFKKWGVKNFVEKTVRWPGFVKFVQNIPEKEFEKSVELHINIPVNADNPDLVWMRVMATGLVCGNSSSKSYELLDCFDVKTGFSAMERATGFTTAIIAEMMAEGKTKPGVNTPEDAFDDSGINEIIDKVGNFLTLKEN